MNAQKLHKILQLNRLLPIVNGKDTELVLNTVKILQTVSLPIIEVAIRDNNSLSTLKTVKTQFPNFCVGAGTIITLKDAQNASSAGADFLISPGFTQKVAKYSKSQNIPYIPGVSTSTEIQNALSYGINVLKWFPAKTLGGPESLSLINGPFQYHQIQFIPSGGIDEESYLEYIKLPNVLAVSGSFITSNSVLIQNDPESTTSYIKRIISKIQSSL